MNKEEYRIAFEARARALNLTKRKPTSPSNGWAKTLSWADKIEPPTEADYRDRDRELARRMTQREVQNKPVSRSDPFSVFLAASEAKPDPSDDWFGYVWERYVRQTIRDKDVRRVVGVMVDDALKDRDGKRLAIASSAIREKTDLTASRVGEVFWVLRKAGWVYWEDWPDNHDHPIIFTCHLVD